MIEALIEHRVVIIYQAHASSAAGISFHVDNNFNPTTSLPLIHNPTSIFLLIARVNSIMHFPLLSIIAQLRCGERIQPLVYFYLFLRQVPTTAVAEPLLNSLHTESRCVWMLLIVFHIHFPSGRDMVQRIGDYRSVCPGTGCVPYCPELVHQQAGG